MPDNSDQTTWQKRLQAVLNPAKQWWATKRQVIKAVINYFKKWWAEQWQLIQCVITKPSVACAKLKQWIKSHPWRFLIEALFGFPMLIAIYSFYLKLFSIVQLQLLWTIIGAVATLSLLFWRGLILAKQADTAAKQADTAASQADTAAKQADTAAKQFKIAKRTQLEGIFSRAVEQISNQNLSLRLGGLSSLRALAEQDEVDLATLNRISNLLCDLLRYPPPLDGWQSCDPPARDGWWKQHGVKAYFYQELVQKHSTTEQDNPSENEVGIPIPIGRRPDIATIAKLLSDMKAMQANLTIAAQFVLLQGTGMRRAQLQGADMSYAQLQDANLWNAQLQGADMSYAQLQDATLGDAQLQGADMRCAQLQRTVFGGMFGGTNISACDLRNTQGLTEGQLKGCYYDEGSEPPILPAELAHIVIECRQPKQ